LSKNILFVCDLSKRIFAHFLAMFGPFCLGQNKAMNFVFLVILVFLLGVLQIVFFFIHSNKGGMTFKIGTFFPIFGGFFFNLPRSFLWELLGNLNLLELEKLIISQRKK